MIVYYFCACRILMIYRTVYRVVEFVDGWGGKVNKTQWYFSTSPFATLALAVWNPNQILTAVVFDGIMISLAMLTLNAFHPGVFLRVSDYPVPTNSEDLSLDGHPKTGNVVMREV